MFTNFVFYLTSFVGVWFGAGLIIEAVDKIAKKLRLSPFIISFFLLGFLTSTPEMSVAINSLIERKAEVFVGTFLGASIVIFLFVIPLLAILGNGIKINHEMEDKYLIFSLFIVVLPYFLILDHKISNPEGILLIILYGILFLLLQKKHGLLEKERTEILSLKIYSFLDLIKIVVGVVCIFIYSDYIVYETLELARIFNLAPFYISLIILAIGTNLPELSLAIRAVVAGKKDIAFGDYLGSAVVNSFLLGIFTVLNAGEVLTVNNFLITFLFILSGLTLFYYFSRSRKDISRNEGLVLISIYILFVIYEISKQIYFK